MDEIGDLGTSSDDEIINDFSLLQREDPFEMEKKKL